MSDEEIEARKRVEGYKPPPEFEEDEKESLVDLTSSDSHELWLIQWPANQPLDFDGQELSLNLHRDGQLGSFEGSSGKVYEVVSFAAHDPDATVFLSSSQESKIVGKISRRVSLVHYSDPKELEKVNVDKPNPTHPKSSRLSFVTSSRKFQTPTQSSAQTRAPSVSRQTTTHSSKQKSSLSEIGEASKPAISVDQSLQKSSKKRDRSEPTTGSIGQSTPNSQRGSSGITGSQSSE